MTTPARKLGLTVAGLLLSILHTVAFAQATQWDITYAPATPASIPTLSEWGMLVLALLVAAAAVLSLRSKVGNRTLMSLAFVCALVLAGVTGDKVIGSANAFLIEMSNPAGGAIPTFGYDGSGLEISNTSGVDQRVIGITPTVPVPTTSPTCEVNLVVPAGGSCFIATTTPPLF